MEKNKKIGCYTLKTYENKLYVWCPDKTIKKRIGRVGANVVKYYCNATAGSQGEDWRCSYVYQNRIVRGIVERSAYVACDYVQ